MGYVLLGSDSSGQYNSTNTIYCPEAWQVNITAVGFNVCYQMQQWVAGVPESTGSQLWLSEEVLAVAQVPAGTTPLTLAGLSRRCAGIRMRSQVAGQFVVFQAVLVPPEEISPDYVLQGKSAVAARTGGVYPANF